MVDRTVDNLILPVGTQVVARVPVHAPDGRIVLQPGAVGEVIQAPVDWVHSYRVRFVDGVEAALKREELAVLAHFKDPAAGVLVNPLHEYNLFDAVIYRCIVGSRAYGLDDEQSDTDLRGIYLPPAEMHWSLYGVPEQIENPTTDEVYWELQKFVVLALKANPNILECLYTPLVLHGTPLAQELLAMRESFLSKLIYQTYNGYVMSQFRKLQADIRNKGEPKPKHVMHLIRLLLSGVTALREGYVPVRVAAHHERLLANKRSELPFDKANAWRLELHKEFDAAFAATKLPDRPDYAKANAFLVRARKAMAA